MASFLFELITSKVVGSPSLDLGRDGRPDGGRLVSIHRQHSVVFQGV